MRSYKKLALTAGLVVVSVGVLAGQSIAEPGSTPSDTTIVAAGSDTIQAISDQYQADYTGTPGFVSYDASSPSGVSATITPKVGCQAITRPNGSGAGISAIAANARPSGDTTDYCIDIARSSSTLVPGTSPAGLAGVQIGGDAVTWSASKVTNAPVNLTTAELTAIYTCDDSSLGGSGNPVTWDEVGGTGTDAIVPVIPQSSSGTRKFFLSKIGVTTLGSCVVTTDGTAPDDIEENEGTNAVFSGASSKDVVFPYSIAVYLAQSEHGHTDNGTPGNLVLKEVNGIAPTSGKKAPSIIVNKKFPYSRDVFYIVRSTGKKAGYVPTYLQAFLGKNNDSGWICKSKTAQADLLSYGFLSLGSKCGKVTTTS